jgi:hypothetical protein
MHELPEKCLPNALVCFMKVETSVYSAGPPHDSYSADRAKPLPPATLHVSNAPEILK